MCYNTPHEKAPAPRSPAGRRRLVPLLPDGPLRVPAPRRPRLHLPLRLREGRPLGGEREGGVREPAPRRHLDARHLHLLYGRHHPVRPRHGPAPPRQRRAPHAQRPPPLRPPPRPPAANGGRAGRDARRRVRRPRPPRHGLLGAPPPARRGRRLDRRPQGTPLRPLHAPRPPLLAAPRPPLDARRHPLLRACVHEQAHGHVLPLPRVCRRLPQRHTKRHNPHNQQRAPEDAPPHRLPPPPRPRRRHGRPRRLFADPSGGAPRTRPLHGLASLAPPQRRRLDGPLPLPGPRPRRPPPRLPRNARPLSPRRPPRPRHPRRRRPGLRLHSVPGMEILERAASRPPALLLRRPCADPRHLR